MYQVLQKRYTKSSAQPIEQATQKILVLFDWMTYVDTLTPPINQWDMVKYISTRPDDALNLPSHFWQAMHTR